MLLLALACDECPEEGPARSWSCDGTGLTEPLPVCSEEDPCLDLLETYCMQDQARISVSGEEPECAERSSWTDGDGTVRWWCEYPPEGDEAPLWIFVPGSGGTADGMEQLTNLRSLAEGEGVFLVSVQPRLLHWPTESNQDGTKHDTYHRDFGTNPDVAFYDHLIDDLVARGAVDPARIWLTGWSNGGRFAALYGVGRYETPTPGGNRVAAVANYSAGDPWAHLVEGDDCGADRPSTSLPFMLVSRDCDVVTGSTDHFESFVEDGEHMTLGNDAEAWLGNLESMGADTTWLLLDRKGREVEACKRSCSMSRALLNHVSWPTEHEAAMLTFLQEHSL